MDASIHERMLVTSSHERLHMPDKRQFTYQTPIIKVQEYTLDEIFQKKLLALLPYYILRYEKS